MLTDEQRELARHALGLGNDRKQSYRNRFVTGPGGADHPAWLDMVQRGLAKQRMGSTLPFGGDDLFWLTKQGATLALSAGETLDPEDFPDAPNT